MTLPAPFRGYPAIFPSHSRRARRYALRDDCFAGPAGAPALRRLRVIYVLPGEDLAVYSGPPPAGTELELRPVYAFSAEELPAVPTGRVFVQSSKAGDLAQRVARLGYRIESVPQYAPHAAWLVAADGAVATALRNVEALIALDGIDSVEPQMLSPAAPRGAL